MMLLILLVACAGRAVPTAPVAPELVDEPPAAEPEAAAAVAAPSAATYPRDYLPTAPDGQPMPFAQWAGQPVLVNVWASWCPPCLQELPELVAVEKQWSAAGLTIVGVAIDDEATRVLATADARGMTWDLALDGSNRASLVFDTVEMPTTLLYDASGALVWKHIGPIPAQDPALEAALTAVLTKVPTP